MADGAARRDADEGFAAQPFQFQSRRGIRHVLLEVKKDKLALAKQLVTDGRGRRHFEGNRDLRLALIELANEIVMVDRLEVELDLLMGAQELGHCGPKHAERERWKRGEAEHCPGPALQIPSCFAQGVDPVLDLADLAEQSVGVFGCDETALGPLEQLEAEQRFRVAERLRNGRLRHVERSRGGADRAVHVDRVENFDVAQLHGPAAIWTDAAPDNSNPQAAWFRSHCGTMSPWMSDSSGCRSRTTAQSLPLTRTSAANGREL